MKCPYRKMIIRHEEHGETCTTVDFADCYLMECPFFIQSESLMGDCGKVNKELIKNSFNIGPNGFSLMSI